MQKATVWYAQIPPFPRSFSGCVLCHGSMWFLQLIPVCATLLGLCVIQTSTGIRLCLPELFLCYRLWVTSWMLKILSAGLSKTEAASDLRNMAGEMKLYWKLSLVNSLISTTKGGLTSLSTEAEVSRFKSCTQEMLQFFHLFTGSNKFVDSERVLQGMKSIGHCEIDSE